MDGGTIDDELRKALIVKYTASIRALMAIRDTKSLGEAVAVLGALRKTEPNSVIYVRSMSILNNNQDKSQEEVFRLLKKFQIPECQRGIHFMSDCRAIFEVNLESDTRPKYEVNYSELREF